MGFIAANLFLLEEIINEGPGNRSRKFLPREDLGVEFGSKERGQLDVNYECPWMQHYLPQDGPGNQRLGQEGDLEISAK